MKQLLSPAIDDYLRWKAQELKPTTLKSHQCTLRRFLAVVGNIYVDKITDRQVIRFMEEASKTRQRQSLRNDHINLNVFFAWCRLTHRMAADSDPFLGRRAPKGVERERERLSVSRFPVLLDAAGSRCARDRIAVAVLLYTLLRDTDVADLRVRDVDLEGGYLTARIHKTGLEDRLPICTELDYELRRWLTIYTEEVGALHPNYRLVPARKVGLAFGSDGRFVNNKERSECLLPERPIGKLGRIVNPILDSIGFPIVDMHGKASQEGAHTIRRSGARALFDRLVQGGYDGALRVVQAMLHHKSVTMTERYIGMHADRRTRDELIRGHMMYGDDSGSNVIKFKQAE